MTKALDYPIKYITLPIVEDDQVSAFIVFKCYLLEELKKYISKDKVITNYKVLPMYNQFKQRINPQYYNGEIINYNYVDSVFDTIDEARRQARSKNDIIVRGKMLNSTTFDRVLYLEKYYELEESMLENNNVVNISDFRRSLKKGG